MADLYYAAYQGDLQTLTTSLAARPSEVNWQTEGGFSLLYVAAQNGHTDCVVALLRSKADVDAASDQTGATPLFVAACNNHPRCVKTLLENQATADKKIKDGSTPLSIATAKGNTECAKILTEAIQKDPKIDPEIIRQLQYCLSLPPGAEPHARIPVVTAPTTPMDTGRRVLASQTSQTAYPVVYGTEYPPKKPSKPPIAPAGTTPAAALPLPGLFSKPKKPEPVEPPNVFICPITQDIMSDPVVAADGYTYEKSAVTKWLSNHNTSPFTGAPIPHKNVISNFSLRSEINSWKDEHPDYQ